LKEEEILDAQAGVGRGDEEVHPPCSIRVVFVKFSKFQMGRLTVSVPAGAARRGCLPARTARVRPGRWTMTRTGTLLTFCGVRRRCGGWILRAEKRNGCMLV
jgi:hypothetical protein